MGSVGAGSSHYSGSAVCTCLDAKEEIHEHLPTKKDNDRWLPNHGDVDRSAVKVRTKNFCASAYRKSYGSHKQNMGWCAAHAAGLLLHVPELIALYPRDH